MFFQFAHHVGNRRCFLADSNINTSNACTFLVDNGIQRNRCFTCLTVTNDQFALATANRNHRVNGFQTSLHWLVNRLTRNHARRNFFDRRSFRCVNRTFAVNRLTQCIHNTANQFTTNRHFQNTACALNFIAFCNMFVFTEDYGTDRITLQVHSQPERIAGELQHLPLHHIGQAIYTHNTIGNRNHRTASTRLCFGI